jgi:hypothetical protein
MLREELPGVFGQRFGLGTRDEHVAIDLELDPAERGCAQECCSGRAGRAVSQLGRNQLGIRQRRVKSR